MIRGASVRLLLVAASLVSAGFSLVPGVARADGGVPGTLTLTTGSGARWLSLGRSGTGDPDADLNPVVNPAQAANLATFSAGLLYARRYEASSVQSLVVGYPIDRRTVAQLTLHRAASDAIPSVDAAGTTIGSTDFGRYEGTLTGAYRLRPDLSVGATLRGVMSSADRDRWNDGALDLGIAYLWDEQAGAGLKIENAAGSKGLARHVRMGLTGRLPSGRASASADVLFAASSAGMGAALRWHAGIEAWVIESVAVRIGMETAGFSAGLGVVFGLFGLDYAAIKTDLGTSHWVSLQMRSRKAPSHASKKKPPAPAKKATPAAPSTSPAVGSADAKGTAVTEKRVAGAAGAVLAAALKAPAGVTAKKDSGGAIEVSWGAVAGATGYDVYVSSFPWETGKKANPSPLHDIRVTLPSIPGSGTIYLRVAAVDASGAPGPYSDTVLLTP